MTQTDLDIFITTAPGFEPVLRDELVELGYHGQLVKGGITLSGDWGDVMALNLSCRGASQVLVRLASFRAMHLAQLDKRARKLAWETWFDRRVPISVTAFCRKSRIYHNGAAAQRVANALHNAVGVTISDKAPIRVLVRIEDDLCTISLDSSGAPLHKRGAKQAVGKAPLRETLAALTLRACGFDGTQIVADPMCGSGTLPIEAAEISAGLMPGRAREFAFRHLRVFDRERWEVMRRAPASARRASTPVAFGFDRDGGAVRNAIANAERAGLASYCNFAQAAISAFTPPGERPGLVVINPPYGGRIGARKPLFALYATIGQVLKARFGGWQLGIISNDAGLMRATDLELDQKLKFDHGGLSVGLWCGRL